MTASPIMERGRSLLDEIRAALGLAVRKRTTKKADDGTPQDNTCDTAAEDSATKDTEDKEPAPEKAAKPRAPRHPGVNRKQLEPDETRNVVGRECPHCHGHNVRRGDKFTIYQMLDIVIRRIVTHFSVWDCVCEDCGKHFKPDVPPEAQAGIGPRTTALTGLLTALGLSRRKIQAFLKQVPDIDISQGGIQKCLDRVSDATTPHYEALQREAQRAPVNYVDETSSRLFGPAGPAKHWLWAWVKHHCLLHDPKHTLSGVFQGSGRQLERNTRFRRLRAVSAMIRKGPADVPCTHDTESTKARGEYRPRNSTWRPLGSPGCAAWSEWPTHLRQMVNILPGKGDSPDASENISTTKAKWGRSPDSCNVKPSI